MGDLDEPKKNRENRWLYNCAKKHFYKIWATFFSIFLRRFFMLRATELKSSIKQMLE